MPSLAPISLSIGEGTEVYNPTGATGSSFRFTDTTPGRLSEWRTAKIDIRPASPANSGHLVEVLLVRPIPVEDQSGCCVDKDATPASTIRITTLLSKSSNADQAQELVDMLVAFAQNTDYQSVVKGASYY